MPNQKQRREAARRHLERQLKARQAREARRRKLTLVTSIVGTLVLIAAVVIIVAVTTSGGKKKQPAASGNQPSTSTSSSSPAANACDDSNPTKVTVRKATGKAVSFMGVTVKGAADLGGEPVITSTSTKKATKLEVKDLVVGKGKAATPTSCVTVQYAGVLYKNGKAFDSSWSRSETAQFSLTGVVAGFTQGIGGNAASHIAPMRVGGRRIMIVPSAMGYGAQASGSIPANSDLVFVVDLKSIDA